MSFFVSVAAGFSSLEVESNPCFTTTLKNRIYELVIIKDCLLSLSLLLIWLAYTCFVGFVCYASWFLQLWWKNIDLRFVTASSTLMEKGSCMGLKGNGLTIGFASKDGTGFVEGTGLKSLMLSTARCFISGRKFTQSRSQSHVDVESLIIIIITTPFIHHYHEIHGFCLL